MTRSNIYNNLVLKEKIIDYLTGGNLYKYYYKKGYRKYKKTNFNEALRYCLRVLDIAPGDKNAMLLTIHCYAKMNKLEEAYQLLKRSKELTKGVDILWFALGGLYDEINMHDMAIICYENSIEKNPENIDALINLGIIYHYNIGQTEKALEIFNKAHNVDKKNVSILTGLANANSDLGMKERAIEYYLEAISLYPDNAELYFNLANTQRELENMEEAEINYRNAIEANNKFAKAYFSLGIISQNKGEEQKARDYFLKAKSLGYIDA